MEALSLQQERAASAKKAVILLDFQKNVRTFVAEQTCHQV